MCLARVYALISTCATRVYARPAEQCALGACPRGRALIDLVHRLSEICGFAWAQPAGRRPVSGARALQGASAAQRAMDTQLEPFRALACYTARILLQSKKLGYTGPVRARAELKSPLMGSLAYIELHEKHHQGCFSVHGKGLTPLTCVNPSFFINAAGCVLCTRYRAHSRAL